MGQSKVELFLRRIVAVAESAFNGVVAVQRAGGEPLQIERKIETIFEASHEGEAAVFGIVAALRHAGQPCFVLAVDYPLVTADLLRYLRDRGGIPTWNGRPQPLCAVWSPDLLPQLEARIEAGVFDLHTLGGQEMIPEGELRGRFGGEPLMNVNTPKELEEAERLYGERFLASR